MEQKAAKRVRREMAGCLKTAKLPGHFVPHSLRHTFCALLIEAGVSPVYVQQQAGRARVEMTVGVYGSWFPVKAPGAMDRLAVGLTSGQPVTKWASTGNIVPAVAAGPPFAYSDLRTSNDYPSFSWVISYCSSFL